MDKDAAVTSQGTQGETFVRGASAAGTIGNDAEAGVLASEVPAPEVPTTDVVEVLDRAEIPHQPEV
jgi:hypothetical protein